MLNMEQLLVPISEQAPCGEDIAFSSEVDAISKARQADDPTLEQGAWVTSLKEADWSFVASRCSQLIAQRSKDLRLAVWLAEASAKTSSMRGLGDGLMLVAALCERYWRELHPLPDDGSQEQRIGNLCWIAARLPQLIQEMSIATTPTRARESLVTDSSYCMQAIEQLERIVDERVGAEGPGFCAARSAMENLMRLIGPAACDMAGATAKVAQAAVTLMAAESGPGSAPLHTRAHAIAQLRQVAEFFRRTEPHSPVAYLADKAATWGEQPLHVWLRGVIKDDATFASIEELLGLQGKLN